MKWIVSCKPNYYYDYYDYLFHVLLSYLMMLEPGQKQAVTVGQGKR